MLKWGGCTDIGRSRPLNEDGYYISEYSKDAKALYAIVADGMGGHQAGEVASAMAIRSVSDYINKHFNADTDTTGLKEILGHALRGANTEIYEKSKETPSLNGMGTTLTMCFILNNRAVVAHVGDSRVYLLREDALHRITVDHSLVQALLSSGKITQEEAENHPQKNVITRALGTESRVEIDLYEFPVLPGELMLLCTDGLSNLLSDPELKKILQENRHCPLEDLAKQLAEEANIRGGFDNITAVLLECEAEAC